jgi:hypothetical protein
MAGAALMVVGSAQASLSSFYQFNGKGNWSIDAIGTSGTGTVQASVPVGSTVEKAFLYSSKFYTSDGGGSANAVTFDGVVIPSGSFTDLGVNETSFSGFSLEAYRADVTAQVAAKVGGGSGSRFDFSVSESGSSAVDGEVLVVVYSNPAEVERTIAVLDGFSASGGDSTTINFSEALTGVGDPGFEALLSLGIGFGFQPTSQFSIVDGNGRQLTTSAGGQDDGDQTGNGSLITAGGLDDSTANPDPDALATDQRTDDELYDLGQGNVDDATPYLSNGLLSYTFDTSNPSNDDNIFFLGLNITARAGVNQPPPPPPDGVPDAGSTALLLGLGVMGMAALRRK